ncbi:MAG: HAD family hydrolase [Clostridia bacterium]|nr:HAD family hydrolase [Clostridia bacterium]
MTERKLILFLDSGDTIIDEGTEIRDENQIVRSARTWPGADDVLRQLNALGFRLCMVADGYTESFEVVYRLLDLYDCFEQRVYSEDVGQHKPHPAMFECALEKMGLTRADCGRILMVGNNLERDVAGANAMGIHSVFIDQSPRYPKSSDDPQAQPEFVIHSMAELPELALRLDAAL